MAWWDHEELKSMEYRSDRYRFTFPDEYSLESNQKMITETLNGKDPTYHADAWALAKWLGFKPRVKVKASTKKGKSNDCTCSTGHYMGNSS